MLTATQTRAIQLVLFFNMYIMLVKANHPQM